MFHICFSDTLPSCGTAMLFRLESDAFRGHGKYTGSSEPVDGPAAPSGLAGILRNLVIFGYSTDFERLIKLSIATAVAAASAREAIRRGMHLSLIHRDGAS